MTKRARRKIDAALKAKIALEALREQATVAFKLLSISHALSSQKFGPASVVHAACSSVDFSDVCGRILRFTPRPSRTASAPTGDC